MRGWMAALALAALAACGSGNDDDYTAELRTDEGDPVTVSVGDSADVDLPDGFSIYDGATIVSKASASTTDGSNSMVILEAGAAPEELVEFYRNQAEAAGYEIKAEMKTDNHMAISGGKDSGEYFTLPVTPEGSGSSAQLITGVDRSS